MKLLPTFFLLGRSETPHDGSFNLKLFLQIPSIGEVTSALCESEVTLIKNGNNFSW